MERPEDIKISEARDFLARFGHAKDHLLESSLAFVGVMQMKSGDSWSNPIQFPQSAQQVTSWLREYYPTRASNIDDVQGALHRLASMGTLLSTKNDAEVLEFRPSELTLNRLAIRQNEATHLTEYANPESQPIIRLLIIGNRVQRSDLLRDILQFSDDKRGLLARKLREALSDDELIPRLLRERSPSWSALDIAKARSWLVSALVYADHDGRDSGQVVRAHVRAESEPEPLVRFWALASFHRRHASTVFGLAREVSDDPELSVRYLSAAIRASRTGETPAGFKAHLEKRSPDRTTTLRVLRIVPIPTLAPSVLRIALDDTPDAGDARLALWVLCHRAMSDQIVRLVHNTEDEPRLVERTLQACVGGDQKDLERFGLLLNRLPEGLIQNALANDAIQGLRETLLTSEGALGINLSRQRPIEEPSSKVSKGAKSTPPSGRLSQSEKTSEERATTADAPSPDTDDRWKHRRSFSAGIADRARRVIDKQLPDQLHVGTFASHLAYLIAARETALPLSIGLFGRWGSGKSHLMDLIQERIEDIAENASPAFHAHIIQIRFNAWHYLDTNLWASLVSEIFEQLFSKLSKIPTARDKLQHLKDKLKDSSALTLEAKEAHDRAKGERAQAEVNLENSRKKLADAQGKVRSLALDDLAALLEKDPIIKATIERVRDQIGIPALASSFQELNARHRDMLTLRGRAFAVLASLGSGRRLFLTGAVIAVAAATSYGIGTIGSWVDGSGKPYLDAITRVTSQITTLVITAVGALAWFIKRGNVLFNAIDQAHRTINEARAKRSMDFTVVAAQDKLEAAHDQEKRAEQSLRDAQERENTISAEISELAPGRQLIRFLKDRTQGDDYSKHLGLVSIVRKDFKELSDLLIPEHGHRDTSLPAVDRIVLYIDDLDRCRSERVTQVLEAVHLLLAFPLFAVVVAVDPRWLRQSLVTQYADLMEMRHESHAVPQIQAATPQDYLEKIFQVPFQVQDMQPDGYRALVDDIFCVDSNQEGRIQIPSASPEAGDDVATSAATPSGSQPIPAASSPSMPTPQRAPTESLALGMPPMSEGALLVRAAMLRSSRTQIHPEQVFLTEWERQDVHRFQPLFSTPRPVKRFANVYALIRISIEEDAWDDFLGRGGKPGDYRIPMSMVAVTAAFPALSQAYLAWLSQAEVTTWVLNAPDIENLSRIHPGLPRVELQALQDGLARVDFSGWPVPETRTLLPWIPRVRRYSF